MVKPQISTFMYALEAGQVKNGMTIRNPLNFIALQHIPNNFTFTIIFGLVGLGGDRSHELKMFFKSPDGKVIHSWGPVSVTVEGVPEDVPPETVGFVSHFQFQNTPLEIQGEYRTEIHVNGEKLGDFPIWVFQRKRQGDKNESKS